MELYGVHHGGDYHFGGISLAKMQVEPAEELLQAIEDLPKGATVGIEAVHPDDLDDNPDSLAFNDEDVHYWQTIAEACDESGHSVAYLDSFDIHKRAARKRIDLRGLENMLSGGDYEVAPGQERTVAEIMFSLEAQFNYLHAVAREDFLLRKIDEIRPRLAVIGLAHADYLMLQSELVQKLGVDNYYKLLIDAPYLTLSSLPLFSGDREVSQFIEQSPPSESALRERELAVRTYHAATLGRIAVGRDPAWIGSWEPGNRPYGLFEVYPSTPASGTIEDRLGTAEYTGEFTDDSLEFTKKYIDSTIYDPTTVTEEIVYDAVRTADDIYEGSWATYGLTGQFIVRRGSHLFDPPDTDFGQRKLF